MRFLIGTISIATALILGTALLVAPSANTRASQGEPNIVSIYFPAGSAELTPEALELLDLAVERIRAEDADVQLVTFSTESLDDTSAEATALRQNAFERAHILMTALVNRGVDSDAIRVLDIPLANDVASQNAEPSFITARRADIVITPSAGSNLSL